MTPQEFTGERFIPGQGGVQLAYEHLHRYLFALRWATGKDVLDVASGSGYGAALLAGVAHRVWAIDIDGPTVALARQASRAANIDFINADGSCLPFPAATMDMAVAFEVIEHVSDQEGMIRELARVLKPGGLALISTPNRATYSDARQYVNPFHLREFYREEFVELLRSGFASVLLLEQQVRAGSLISGDSSPARSGEILTGPIPGERHLATEPMYFLACCGDGPPEQTPFDSAYLDPADSLFREWIRRLMDSGVEIERLNEEIRRLGQWGQDLEAQVMGKGETLRQVLSEVEKRDHTIGQLQELMNAEVKARDETIRSFQADFEHEVGMRDRHIRDLQAGLKREVSQRDEALLKLQEEFGERTRWALSLQEDARIRDERIRSASEHLGRIRRALLYRVLCRLGFLPE